MKFFDKLKSFIRIKYTAETWMRGDLFDTIDDYDDATTTLFKVELYNTYDGEHIRLRKKEIDTSDNVFDLIYENDIIRLADGTLHKAMLVIRVKEKHQVFTTQVRLDNGETLTRENFKKIVINCYKKTGDLIFTCDPKNNTCTVTHGIPPTLSEEELHDIQESK